MAGSEKANRKHSQRKKGTSSIPFRAKLKLSAYHLFAWCARLAILALVAIAPWAYGGVQWQAQHVIVWVAGAIGLTTFLASMLSPRSLYATHLVYFLMGLLLIGLVQTLPLPSWFHPGLSTSAFLSDVNQLAFDSTQLSSVSPLAQVTPTTISVCSPRSQAALAVMATAAVLIWSSSLLFVNRQWAQALVLVLCVSGFANACLGLVQRVAWNNWSWLAFPTSNYYSTFVSKNSSPDYFASAIAGLLVLLSVAHRNRKKDRRETYRMTYPSTSIGGRLRNRMEDLFIDLDTRGVVCLCGIALIGVSVMASNSRGGILAIGAAALVTACMSLSRKDGVSKSFAAGVLVIAVVALMLATLNLDSQVIDRFDELNEVAYQQSEGRLTVWGYTLNAIAWYWLGGSGLCTYQFAILPFHEGQPAVWFQHAENLYLEVFVEFGLAGILCALGALIYFSRDIVRESFERREGMLFPGVVFLLSVLTLHSFVDFSLILPGVFLPASAFFGAFDGRLRRNRALTTRDASSTGDARLSHGSSAPTPSRAVWLRHAASLIVVSICLLTILRGTSHIAGFAQAERLQAALSQFEAQAIKQSVSPADVDAIDSTSKQLASDYPTNPDARLACGRADLLVMRCKLASEIEQTTSDNYADCWQLTHPQATIAFLSVASEDPAIKQLQQVIGGSQTRRQLQASGMANFKAALSQCPMDTRAAWGLYLLGLGQLNDQEERFNVALLTLLSRNNPYVLFKAGLAAITASSEGSMRRQLGMQLVALSIQLNDVMIERGLATLLNYLRSDQIISLLPPDVVLRAQTAVDADGLSPQGHRLAMSLVGQIATQLRTAQASSAREWAAVAWAAEQAGDKPLAIRLLRRTLISGEDSEPVRLKLANLLHENGETSEGIRELEIIIAKNPSKEAELRPVIEKWKQSMDPIP